MQTVTSALWKTHVPKLLPTVYTLTVQTSHARYTSLISGANVKTLVTQVTTFCWNVEIKLGS